MSDHTNDKHLEERLTASVLEEIDAIHPSHETHVGKKFLKALLQKRGLPEFIKAVSVYLEIIDRQTELTDSDLDHRDLIDGTPDNNHDYKHDDTGLFKETSANLLSRRMMLRLTLLGIPISIWTTEGTLGTADRIYEHTLDSQKPGPNRKPSLSGRIADKIAYEGEYPAELSIGLELATELPHIIKTWKLTQLANALGELAEKGFERRVSQLKEELGKNSSRSPSR